MGITSHRLKELGLIDDVIAEPLGGAHRNVKQMAENLSLALEQVLEQLLQLPTVDLVEKRYQRFMQFGCFDVV